MSASASVGVNLSLDGSLFISPVHKMGREEAVQDCLHRTLQECRDKNLHGYHILILSLSQAPRCQPSLQGVFAYSSLHWKKGLDSHTFGVWIFKSGSIDHTREDGGYKNWAFTGGNRSGKGGRHVVRN